MCTLMQAISSLCFQENFKGSCTSCKTEWREVVQGVKNEGILVWFKRCLICIRGIINNKLYNELTFEFTMQFLILLLRTYVYKCSQSFSQCSLLSRRRVQVVDDNRCINPCF